MTFQYPLKVYTSDNYRNNLLMKTGIRMVLNIREEIDMANIVEDAKKERGIKYDM